MELASLESELRMIKPFVSKLAGQLPQKSVNWARLTEKKYGTCAKYSDFISVATQYLFPFPTLVVKRLIANLILLGEPTLKDKIILLI